MSKSTETPEINYILPSILTPLLLTCVFVFVGYVSQSSDVSLVSILIGFYIYGFVIIPAVNIFGWSSLFMMRKLHLDNFFWAMIFGALMGGVILVLMFPPTIVHICTDECTNSTKKMDAFIETLCLFVGLGAVTGVVFRFLAYVEKR